MKDKDQLKKVFDFAFEILETIEKDHAEWKKNKKDPNENCCQ